MSSDDLLLAKKNEFRKKKQSKGKNFVRDKKNFSLEEDVNDLPEGAYDKNSNMKSEDFLTKNKKKK